MKANKTHGKGNRVNCRDGFKRKKRRVYPFHSILDDLIDETDFETS